MNYNAIVPAIYDAVKCNDVRHFANGLFLEITSEDEESVEYTLHETVTSCDNLYYLHTNERNDNRLDIVLWDGYQLIGYLNLKTRSITFLNPYVDENHTS